MAQGWCSAIGMDHGGLPGTTAGYAIKERSMKEEIKLEKQKLKDKKKAIC
jgi:hypothetical protein